MNLKLIRYIKDRDGLSNYNPHIIGITSFASHHTLHQLKELVDAVHIKNSYFNANEIFTELRFAIQSIESNQIARSNRPNQREREIEKEASTILNQFYNNLKKKRHRKCAIGIIQLAFSLQNSENINLIDLYTQIAPTFELKNHSAVNSLMTRYLDEIIRKTDDNVLKQVFRSCKNPTAPTTGEFFNVIIENIQDKLNT